MLDFIRIWFLIKIYTVLLYVYHMSGKSKQQTTITITITARTTTLQQHHILIELRRTFPSWPPTVFPNDPSESTCCSNWPHISATFSRHVRITRISASSCTTRSGLSSERRTSTHSIFSSFRWCLNRPTVYRLLFQTVDFKLLVCKLQRWNIINSFRHTVPNVDVDNNFNRKTQQAAWKGNVNSSTIV